MSEMSVGLRALEMHERETFHHERARRELLGTVVDRPARRGLLRRTARPAA
jgi:hypothetical protein